MGLLKWAAVMAVLAIVAALMGFGGLSEGFADIARILFFIFLVGVIVLVALGVFVGKKIT